jgi:hypothetical protein
MQNDNDPGLSAIDVEKTVLASFIICPEIIKETLPLLTTESFYLTAHQELFKTIYNLSAAGKPIDIIVLSEAGIEAGFLAELSESIGTTANIKEHCRILNEKATRRKITTGSARLFELASSPDVELEKLTARVNDFAYGVNLQNTRDRDLIQSMVYAPNWNNIPEEAPPIMLLGEIKLLSPGNLSLLIAGNGTGKSATCEAIVSAGITQLADSLQFKNNASGVTAYIDTERSQADHSRSWVRTMRRSNTHPGEIPPKLKFELVSTLPSVESRVKYLKEVVEIPELTLLILDGLADFVIDVNEAENCNEFLFWLLSQAKLKNFGIFATLHPNPTDKDKKARGHLGSEAMRRAESVIGISKDRESGVRLITMDFMHGKNRNDTDSAEAAFQWDDSVMMFVSCDPPEGKKPAVQARKEELLNALREKPTYTFIELIEAIVKHTGKTTDQAKGMYQRLKKENKLVTNGGLWAVVSAE